MTQPETVGRIKVVQEWYPLVFVDLHEMGSDSTYYFAPEANPFNPHIMKHQRESLEWFGKKNAHWFDQFGFSYFTNISQKRRTTNSIQGTAPVGRCISAASR